MKPKTTVILVHGAFHGAWCWQPAIDPLQNQGIEAIALDLPGCGYGERQQGTLNDCAELLNNIIANCDGPVVVCGHSLGGATLTEGVEPDSKAKHLVYIAALVPDIGETAPDNAPELLTGEIGSASRRIEDGSVILDPEAAGRIFYHHCDPEVLGEILREIAVKMKNGYL